MTHLPSRNVDSGDDNGSENCTDKTNVLTMAMDLTELADALHPILLGCLPLVEAGLRMSTNKRE